MAASISAVAPIWQTAPNAVQRMEAALGRGSVPQIAKTRASARIPNGRPKRNLTCVAPTVPSSGGQVLLCRVPERLGGGRD